MNFLSAFSIKTPLGEMLAVGNDHALYLLEFSDRPGLKRQLDQLQKNTHSLMREGISGSIHSVIQELSLYFQGTLREFQTPVYEYGTVFQKTVWRTLQTIPLGQTLSYSDLAKEIGQPAARRAVARANSTNRIAIVIPCHRVVCQDGTIGGYAGGVDRKKWLLHHEKNER